MCLTGFPRCVVNFAATYLKKKKKINRGLLMERGGRRKGRVKRGGKEERGGKERPSVHGHMSEVRAREFCSLFQGAFRP